MPAMKQAAKAAAKALGKRSQHQTYGSQYATEIDKQRERASKYKGLTPADIRKAMRGSSSGAMTERELKLAMGSKPKAKTKTSPKNRAASAANKRKARQTKRATKAAKRAMGK